MRERKHSTLRSFSFGTFQGNIPESILDLFVGHENDKVRGESILDYSLEIIEAVADGRITNLDSFNIDGFVFKIQENQKFTGVSSTKKETHINIGEHDEEDRSGVNEENIKEQEDLYEKVNTDLDLGYAVKKINELSDVYMIMDGVDIIHLLRNAVRGLSQAQEKLKELCDSYKELGDVVYDILSSRCSVEDLFPEQYCVCVA